MILAHPSPDSPRSVLSALEEEHHPEHEWTCASSDKVVGDCSSSLSRRRRTAAPTLRLTSKRVTFDVASPSASDEGGPDMWCNPHDETEEKEEEEVSCNFGPVRPELSKEEIQSMCWTNRNFKEFKLEAKKLAHQPSGDDEGRGDYVRIFLKMYSTPPKDERRVGFVNSKDWSAIPLAIAPTRGLERYVFPGLVQDQKRVKESVLKAQASLPKELDQSTRGRILASTSEILSRQSRHIARVLGHADSIIALSIYKRTFPVQK